MVLGIADKKGKATTQKEGAKAVMVSVPEILVKTFGVKTYGEKGFKSEMTEEELRIAMDNLAISETRLNKNPAFLNQLAAEIDAVKIAVKQHGLHKNDKLSKPVSRAIKALNNAIDDELDALAETGETITAEERIATKQVLAYAMIKEGTEPQKQHGKASKHHAANHAGKHDYHQRYDHSYDKHDFENEIDEPGQLRAPSTPQTEVIQRQAPVKGSRRP